MEPVDVLEIDGDLIAVRAGEQEFLGGQRELGAEVVLDGADQAISVLGVFNAFRKSTELDGIDSGSVVAEDDLHWISVAFLAVSNGDIVIASLVLAHVGEVGRWDRGRRGR